MATTSVNKLIEHIWLGKSKPFWPNLLKKETGFNYPKRPKWFSDYAVTLDTETGVDNFRHRHECMFTPEIRQNAGNKNVKT